MGGPKFSRLANRERILPDMRYLLSECPVEERYLLSECPVEEGGHLTPGDDARVAHLVHRTD
jgi:hypothetical protein